MPSDTKPIASAPSKATLASEALGKPIQVFQPPQGSVRKTHRQATTPNTINTRRSATLIGPSVGSWAGGVFFNERPSHKASSGRVIATIGKPQTNQSTKPISMPVACSYC